MTERIKFTCPGRIHASALPDFFTTSGKCTYCGSMEPEVFLRRVENGVEVTAVKETKTFFFVDGSKFCFHHLDTEQHDRLKKLYLDGKLKVKNKV